MQATQNYWVPLDQEIEKEENLKCSLVALQTALCISSIANILILSIANKTGLEFSYSTKRLNLVGTWRNFNNIGRIWLILVVKYVWFPIFICLSWKISKILIFDPQIKCELSELSLLWWTLSAVAFLLFCCRACKLHRILKIISDS